MPEKVTVMPGLAAPQIVGSVDSVIDILERLLDRARAGEVQAIAYAGVEPSGQVFFNWECGRARTDSLVAAITALDFKFKEIWVCKGKERQDDAD